MRRFAFFRDVIDCEEIRTKCGKVQWLVVLCAKLPWENSGEGMKAVKDKMCNNHSFHRRFVNKVFRKLLSCFQAIFTECSQIKCILRSVMQTSQTAMISAFLYCFKN